MTKKINEPTETIAAAYSRWKRNRDMIAGEDAVKLAGESYLPRLGNQSTKDYTAYLARCPFFPGAARTHDGMLGLVTRKDGVLEGIDGLEAIFDTITHDGMTVDDLVEEVFSETLKTAFTGLLVDLPIQSEPGTLTVAKVEKQNLRPFIAIYQAESILEVTPGVVDNRRKIVRVRLLEEGGDVVRELALDNGIYTVIRHFRDGNQWLQDAPVIPLKGGRPMSDIPFVLVTQKARAFSPGPGPLDRVVDINKHCYLAQAEAKNSRYYSSAPILTILGAEEGDLTINPGTVLYFPGHSRDHPVEVKFTEFSGAGQETLEKAVSDFKDDMAKVGSNILAAEKSAAEAAETHAIRRSSENAVLASLARTVSRKVEEALNLVAEWLGRPEGSVSFELNTDFVPTPMTAQERTAALAEYMSGAISQETYFGMLIEGEVLSDSFDIEEEVQRLAVDSANADRPADPATDEAPVAPVE